MNDRPETGGGATTATRCAASLLLALMLVTVLAVEFGCRRSSPPPSTGSPRDPEAQRAQGREMFNYAMGMFFEYERYDSSEWLQQAVDRLDRWVRDQEPFPDWELDPMVETLPKPFLELVEALKLGRLEFSEPDANGFREAVWLRDVSNWARGDSVDELDQAQALFDWTVRNVQLEWDLTGQGSSVTIFRKPWETLLLGQSTATSRAWLFILLARQQGIDAALLAITDPKDPTGERVQPWAVTVLSQGQLYLFDPTLGLPIPAPDAAKLDEAGRLSVRPATLAQVAADDALLRQLDVGQYRYPVEASRVQKVVVLLEASPLYLSQRMKLVESQLTGAERLVLTVDPSEQAKRFKACAHVGDVRLWGMPYQAMVQELQLGSARTNWLMSQLAPFEVLPTLWKGRQCHLKGVFTGDQSAATFYHMARPPDRLLDSGQISPQFKPALARAKMSASYWLGLIADHQGNAPAAIDWFGKRTLEAAPEGVWAQGARYNLGRVYEAQGEIQEAVAMYRSDAKSPARHGNFLRAHWLLPSETPEATEGPTPEAAETPATEPGEKPPPESQKPAPESTEKAAPERSEKLTPEPGEAPTTDSPTSAAAGSGEQQPPSQVG